MRFRWVPKRWQAWLRRPAAPAPTRVTLPWWGSFLHQQDKQAIQTLLDSAARLTHVMQQPGWQDVEAVMNDWMTRYTQQAQRLGQVMREERGQLVLAEEDTPTDDRRRLIAAAQVAALKGFRAELLQRARLVAQQGKRDHDAEPAEDDGALL